MSARASPEASGACPVCGEPIAWSDLSRLGVIHGRSAARGGPYFTIQCPACDEHLVAEAIAPRLYRYLRSSELPASSSLRRALLFFLGVAPGLAQRGVRQAGRSPARQGRPAPPGGSGGPPPGRKPPPHRRRAAPASRVAAELAVLGLGADADLEAVRRRYRSLAKTYHPDRFASAPEAERQLAHRQFIEMAAAYRRILAEWPGC